MLIQLRSRALRLLHRLDWTGPLIVRLTLGLVFTLTGWGKLHSLDQVVELFRSLNIPAASVQAPMVATIEFVGGLLLLVGLGTRIASALLIGTMAVAIYTVQLPELHGVADLARTTEWTYLAMFVWLVVSGAGKASLDYLIVRRGPAELRVGVAP